MALNVWLVFVRGYDAQKLHHLEKWYILFAYGLPAITAIIYLIHDHNSGQHIVGPAIVGSLYLLTDILADLTALVLGAYRVRLDAHRILLRSSMVRMSLSPNDGGADHDRVLAGTTMSIYICVGVRIYRQRAVLRTFARKARQFPDPSASRALEDPFVTTESRIFVTTEIEHNVQKDKHTSRPASSEVEQKWQTPSSSPEKSTFAQPADEPDSIRSSTPGSLSKSVGRYSLLVPLNPSSPQRHTQPLLISYRASAYAAPLASGEFATLPSPRAPVFQPTEHAAHVKRRRENAAAYAYFNVAFLMFVALVIIWVPSSINRLYQIAHPDNPNYGLNIVSALVLPMQGVWNATIYASNTWSECKRAYETIISKFTGATLSRQSSIETDQDETIKYNANIEDGGIMISFRRKFVPGSSAKTI